MNKTAFAPFEFHRYDYALPKQRGGEVRPCHGEGIEEKRDEGEKKKMQDNT